jgi:hypothetical protein
MILALEYVLRTGVLKTCVNFPTSIFIEHRRWNDKIVITIAKRPDGTFCIKHWFVSRCKGQYLPNFLEFNVSDIFNDDRVILSDYYILKFTPNPYLYGRKQYSDAGYGLVQAEEYQDYMTTFFNPVAHVVKKTNWLWEAFAAVHKSEMKQYDNPYSYPYFGYNNISDLLETQRAKVKEKSKHLWANWGIWKKYMLDFQDVVATELVFQKAYSDKNDKEDDDDIKRILL